MCRILKQFFRAAVPAVIFVFPVLAQDDASRLYSRYESSIYKVEVVTPGAENKTSLGTGFVIGRDNILASNFHVVAGVVNEPERYKLEWESDDGRKGPLTVIAVDVVHDLSLLQAGESLGRPLTTTSLPDKGSPLFSLGHPLALDLSIVTGTANGLLENSLYEKIHFTGNLNPGMSGGPALDSKGNVVGVNVSTANNAVSFLVPASYLDALVNRAAGNDFQHDTDLIGSIGTQLFDNQQMLINEMLGNDWPSVTVGNFSVPGKVSDRLDCWSDNQLENEDRKYRVISSICRGQDSIFLSENQRAGSVSFEFFWLDTDSLSSRTFYRLYQSRNGSRFFTGARKEDVGNFTCSTRFIALTGRQFKANVCARPYKRHPQLADFMVLMTMVGEKRQGMIFTLDLSTVTLDNGLRLLQRFLEHIAWQN